MLRLSQITRADNPGPLLARLRAEGPLVRVRVPMLGPVWLATTDAAARALLKDPRITRDVRVARGKPLDRAYWWMPRSITPLLESLLTRDGAAHRALRAPVEPAFARLAIAGLRPGLEARADRLLDGMAREVDLGAAYTRALPFEAIVALLGLRDETVARMKPSVGPLSNVAGPLSILMAMWHLRKLLPILREAFAEARRAPRAGLLGDLIAAEADSEDELLSMVFTLFVAGHETTVHLLNNAVLTLCDRPELRPELAEERARALFVEEVMRMASPVAITTVAYATEAFTYEGVPLAPGDRVSACLISAGRDPARHDTPEAFRADRRPNAHLGFGHGPHVCLGVQLARLEASVGIERLLARYPDFRLAARPGWTKRAGFRGPDRPRLILSPRG